MARIDLARAPDRAPLREVPRLRIAQVAPPLERVPPPAYGGTERIVYELTKELVARGHDVTVFASGDSEVPARHIPTVDQALRPAGVEGDSSGWYAATVEAVLAAAGDFDVIHSHLEWWSIPLARMSPVPVISTFHGRLDLPFSDRLFQNAPDGLVAISRNQASFHPDVPWTIIHNGLTLDRAPFQADRSDAFCFVGRVDPEKGIIEAIEIAERCGRPLRIAAKVGTMTYQRAFYEDVFQPALARAGRDVEYLGELSPEDRDHLFADSYATLMPGAWPEPFGLVTIESLACGTPILARRVGALPEIIREGVDGFFGDDAMAMAYYAEKIADLDRAAIRERVIERFSAARMTDRYEELFARTAGIALPGTSPASAEPAILPIRFPPTGRAARPGAEDAEPLDGAAEAVVGAAESISPAAESVSDDAELTAPDRPDAVQIRGPVQIRRRR